MAVPADTPFGAVFGPGTHHQGDLAFEGRIRVDGTFSGRLYTEDALEVGAGGRVEGEVDVARANVAGTVSGRLRVREHLLVQATGTIEGMLDAGLLEVQPGARISAMVRVSGEELP